MNWLIIYNRDTLQIEHFVSCSSKMPTLADLGIPLDPAWDTVSLLDPPFEISRDHRLIIENAEVVNTEYSLNPVQPEPPEPEPDWKAEWKAARNLEQKIRVIARIHGLE